MRLIPFSIVVAVLFGCTLIPAAGALVSTDLVDPPACWKYGLVSEAICDAFQNWATQFILFETFYWTGYVLTKESCLYNHAPAVWLSAC